MEWLKILLPIISGIIGGNLAGANMKKYNLGPTGNSIAGLVGGVAGGALLGMFGGNESMPLAAQAGSLDLGGIVAAIAGGGVGGGAIMAIVGAIKEKMQKKGP